MWINAIVLNSTLKKTQINLIEIIAKNEQILAIDEK